MQTYASLIKQTLRTLRSTNDDVTKAELFDALRETADDFESVKHQYERLRKHGEIYSYPSGGVVVVRITEDRL